MDYHKIWFLRPFFSTYMRHSQYDIIEDVLTSSLDVLDKYFHKLRLQSNPTKMEIIKLCNRSVGREFNIHFKENQFNHNKYPKYLGFTLSRTLSYKEDLMKTADKLKNRNNILHKLCSTSWVSATDML